MHSYYYYYYYYYFYYCRKPNAVMSELILPTWPMQWMLDLRTYGMKIHFSTTSDGYIDWDGGDGAV